MTKRGSRTTVWRAAVLAIAAAVQSCGGDGGDENRILPLTAEITIPAPAGTSPLVYLRRNSVSGDTVFVDIVLRPMVPLTYDAFAFAFRFNPAIVQVGMIKDAPNSAVPDLFATPFGDCNVAADPLVCSAVTTSPICSDNTDPGSPDYANATGTLILGVARAAACNPASAGTETRLLTLSLTGASVGESTFAFLPNTIDLNSCRIWQYPADPAMPLVDLGVPCDTGVAMFEASR